MFLTHLHLTREYVVSQDLFEVYEVLCLLKPFFHSGRKLYVVKTCELESPMSGIGLKFKIC